MLKQLPLSIVELIDLITHCMSKLYNYVFIILSSGNIEFHEKLEYCSIPCLGVLELLLFQLMLLFN